MVTVYVTPTNGGTVKLNGVLYTSPKSVADDSLALFEAIPAEGYEFVNWRIIDTTAYLSRSTNPTQYLITCDATVTANFQASNEPPVADAGDDQDVDEGSTVTLDGSASYDPDGEIASYLWTQTGGTEVTLSDPDVAQPTFTAPEVDAGGAALIFELTVTDSEELDDSDTCTVTVLNTEQPPVADAGADQNVVEGTIVTLDGSASSDPDNDIESYQWTQTGGTDAELSDETAVQPTFIAPDPWPNGVILTFELTVTDSRDLEDADSVNVRLLKTGWMEISGTVLYEETPQCVMVLANGEYVFTDGEGGYELGEYELEVPLNVDGQIELFGFGDGFAPYNEVFMP